jgi:hypothetical protein
MSYQYMTDRLVAVIQELRDYLGPEAYGLSFVPTRLTLQLIGG